MLCHITHPDTLRDECRKYLGERTGTYEFRCHRFKSVADELFKMGLQDEMTIIDVGSGMCEFDYYLRTDRNWKGIYVPVDGLQGINIDHWRPSFKPDFITGLEIIEHLNYPHGLIYNIEDYARIGGVLTTPNPKTTDVLGMDRTHVCECPEEMFNVRDGWKTEIKSHFGKPADSVLAVWKR